MVSIRTRLLLAASALLLVFIGLCGAALESAFRQSAQDAQESRLRGLVYALLGAAEPDEQNRLSVRADALPEPRLAQPQSGLEAAILDERGRTLWHSPSVIGEPPIVIGPEVGRWKFERLEPDGRFALTFGLRWIGDGDSPRRYTVLMLEEPEEYEQQLSIFRQTLWLWLGIAAVALLAALLLVQRWGLRPLRRLAADLQGVELGRQVRIDTPYPPEIAPLTAALNALIVSERNQLQRHRNALGDLAHSLKTPLAVLRGLGADERVPADLRRPLEEQVGQMQQIVDHQLSRAATAGRRALAQPVPVAPVADKLFGALNKVYADRKLTFDRQVEPDFVARVDAGDLYEMLGNLLDNAAKWAHRRVQLHVARNAAGVVFACDDDGPGFPENPEPLLGRGVRADSRTPGQGLGLAAVAEIVAAYAGTVTLGRSDALGGARVVLQIPDA